jgi:ADP-heptose:LPS heptosyltransferase
MQFDLALAPSPRRDDLTDLAMLSCEAPLRIGWESPYPRGENATDGEGWDAFYTHLIPLRDAPYSEPERYQHVAKVLGLDPGDQELSWPSLPEATRAVARRFATARKGPTSWLGLWCAPGDITGFHRWREALQPLLQQTPGLGLVLLGSGGWRLQPEIGSVWQDLPVLDLRGQLPAAEQLETLAACRVVVGIEGPWVHLCEARGIPQVVLLGGGAFARRAPLSPLAMAVCRPLACYFCDWACDQDARHCLGDIPPAAITEAVRVTLSRPASKPRLMICPASPDAFPPPLDLEPLLAPGACERIPAPVPLD